MSYKTVTELSIVTWFLYCRGNNLFHAKSINVPFLRALCYQEWIIMFPLFKATGTNPESFLFPYLFSAPQTNVLILATLNGLNKICFCLFALHLLFIQNSRRSLNGSHMSQRPLSGQEAPEFFHSPLFPSLLRKFKQY